MVNVDRVYQRVLVLANKEQRGYITPQEFNLFANRAQMETFEQYFYDIAQFSRVHGVSHDYADALTNLEEKISFFKVWNLALQIGNTPWGDAILPDDLYRLGNVYADNWSKAEPISRGTQQQYYNRNPLTKGTLSRPFYTRKNDTRIQFYPYNAAPANGTVHVDYIKKPTTVKWGYVIVNDEALYDSSSSVDFEMHPSEESELVTKILFLAGIVLNKPGLAQVAKGEEIGKIQQEKQ